MIIQPKVSVVMSVYNNEAFLSPAIESILNQSYHDFEFIIVNDGSTDKSAEILHEYRKKDDRIFVYEQENQGCAAAQNRACQSARGEYIAQMDADDISFSDRLERQMDFLKRHPNVAVLGGAMIVINNNKIPVDLFRYPLNDKQIKEALPYRCPFSHPTIVKRKEAFLAVKGYRSVFRQGADYDLWLRMAEYFEFANLPDPLVYYRLHPGQISTNHLEQHVMFILGAQASARIRRERECDPLDGIHKITYQNLQQFGITKQNIQNALAGGYLWWINLLLKAKHPDIAVELLNKALACSYLKSLPKHLTAKFYLADAKISYQQGKLLSSLSALIQAFWIRSAK